MYIRIILICYVVLVVYPAHNLILIDTLICIVEVEVVGDIALVTYRSCKMEEKQDDIDFL